MPIVYRHFKDAPLTIEELDNNFKNLDERLAILESANAPIEGIKEITQEGDSLVIKGTLGTELGRVVLPKPSFNPRGTWQSRTAYYPHDVVQYRSKIYMAMITHVAGDFEVDEHEQKWKLLIDFTSLVSTATQAPVKA